MGKRTGRPRGAPIGNTNRLIHGGYSAHRIRRRKETNVLLRRCRNLTRRIEMMAWSRKALRRKLARRNEAGFVYQRSRRAMPRLKFRITKPIVDSGKRWNILAALFKGSGVLNNLAARMRAFLVDRIGLRVEG